MSDLSIYFQPIALDFSVTENQIGAHIHAYTDSFPTLDAPGCALIFVSEFRGMDSSVQLNFSEIRTHFYYLYPELNWNKTLYDLGTILPGSTLEDSYFALANVVAELIKKDIVPIVIGGSQDLTIAMYNAYEKLEQLVNTCAIDYTLDLGQPETGLAARNYISQLLVKRPCYLFNHATIGVQYPYCASEELTLFDKLFFDVCRLGEFNQDFKKAEPHLRNADLISVDMRAIKSSEQASAGMPNGFYAEQLCQIAKYAGIADKVTSIGFFQTEQLNKTGWALLAEAIWYFLQGYHARVGDFPIGSKADYTKFTVFMEEVQREIIFYKSNKSARWWMEVPYPPQSGTRYERHHLVPCDKHDYDNAMINELPDLWWKTYQKLG